MTLAELAQSYARHAASYEDHILDVIAFLGRYAHQPYSECTRLTVRRLLKLSSKISKILEDEKKGFGALLENS